MVSFAGIDRKVAVEIFTFSADELRTGLGSVTLAKDATCQQYGQPPAAWLFS